MNYYGNPITRLIEQLAGLPGIGGKSAQRLAFHIIHMPEEKVAALAGAILEAKQQVHYCSVCCNLTDEDPCPVCANPNRDHGTIMVVEDPRDMAAYERTREFHGVYHVLHGAISPMTGTENAETDGCHAGRTQRKNTGNDQRRRCCESGYLRQKRNQRTENQP